MKAFPLAILLLSVLPLSAQENDSAQAPPQLTAEQQAFTNLPEEKRKLFMDSLQEASRLFQQKRIFETMDALDKAEKVFDGSSEVLNLRGSCFVEMRAFDKALDCYTKALKISPENISIQFNMAEVLFVTKEWKKANDLLYTVLTKLPPQNTSMTRLVEFKILLCKKKLGLKEEAIALSEKYDYMDDSPYYYFAQAAREYDAKNEVKAEEWVAMAGRVFRDPAILSPWQDTMIEYGYVKSFYGGDTNQ